MEIIRDYSVFDPLIYLQEYYSGVPPENREHLRFLVDAFRAVPADSLVLDFGGGPSIYSLIPAAQHAREIHYSEYLAANRAEVQKWLNNDPHAFDWLETIQTVLELENGEGSAPAITRREAAIRRKVTQILHCDVLSQPPLEVFSQPYDVIVSNLCLEAAAHDLDHYQWVMNNLASLLKSDGQLIMVASKGTKAYAVGEKAFSVLYILEDDVRRALVGAGFVADSIQIELIPADHPVHSYQGLMCITARKG